MSKITRRQFSFATAATAAAAATSASIRRAHGQESPNEKMSMAIIGCGGRGGSHVGGFSGMKNVEIQYLVDPDPGAGEKRAKAVEGLSLIHI